MNINSTNTPEEKAKDFTTTHGPQPLTTAQTHQLGGGFAPAFLVAYTLLGPVSALATTLGVIDELNAQKA